MAHPAAYWVLTRREERGREVEPRPTDGIVSMVGSDLSEFPYPGDEPCKLCGNILSRYNPSVVCSRCTDEAYENGTAHDRRVRRLFDERRPLNPKYVSVRRSDLDVRMMRRGRSGKVHRSTANRRTRR